MWIRCGSKFLSTNTRSRRSSKRRTGAFAPVSFPDRADRCVRPDQPFRLNMKFEYIPSATRNHEFCSSVNFL